MKKKKDEVNYNKLSRKELQVLCRKHRLSADRSKSRMAKSLACFFQRVNSLSHNSEEDLNIPEEFFLPAICLKLESTEKGVRKRRQKAVHLDIHSLSSSRKVKTHDKEHLQGINQGELRSHTKARISDEVSNATKNKFQRNSDGQPKEDFLCSISCQRNTMPGCNILSSRDVSGAHASFQFFVGSEEGIKIFVDFSSSTLEWVKSFDRDMYMNQEAKRCISEIIQPRLESSKTGNKLITSSTTNNMDSNFHSGLDKQNADSKGYTSSFTGCKPTLRHHSIELVQPAKQNSHAVPNTCMNDFDNWSDERMATSSKILCQMDKSPRGLRTCTHKSSCTLDMASNRTEAIYPDLQYDSLNINSNPIKNTDDSISSRSVETGHVSVVEICDVLKLDDSTSTKKQTGLQEIEDPMARILPFVKLDGTYATNGDIKSVQSEDIQNTLESSTENHTYFNLEEQSRKTLHLEESQYSKQKNTFDNSHQQPRSPDFPKKLQCRKKLSTRQKCQVIRPFLRNLRSSKYLERGSICEMGDIPRRRSIRLMPK